jgi:hypothetical protein
MAWLLDTNILSELRRPKPEQKVVAFVAGCPLDQLYISAVTFAEIRFGITGFAFRLGCASPPRMSPGYVSVMVDVCTQLRYFSIMSLPTIDRCCRSQAN